MFQGANRGGADRDDAAAFAAGAADGIGSCGRQGVELGVHMNVLNTLHVNGLKRTEADMEGDMRGFDAARVQAA